ncbi:MFS transporter [Halopseudomonas pelagia]|uniref:MFS transporter n=1 Tax=Halopseudomonas pelagia TaxID=553151 RepID=A0AA91U0T8_9GAMM|nr:MFS transporter [Halopseudomonas pelagia]PCC98383.1 MFS transporter [Halopseudomonas pelagia]QFY58770.1 MFS transporter [Halopseudomonas pelagia]
MVMVVLNTAIANVALPAIAVSLDVSPAMSVRVITAYQMALLMALLPCAALGERLGYRRVFALGVMLFTAATVLCSLAPSLPWLLAARFMQGLGGAAVMALGVALLRSAVAPDQLGAAIGWNAMAVALSSAAGPAIGALVLSATTWPWLFALQLPLGLFVLLITRSLHDNYGTASSVDLLSMALNVGMFGTLVFAVDVFIDRPILAGALLAVSGLQLVALVKREMPKKAPLIPIDLLGSRSFSLSVLASVFCFAGQTAAIVALPFYLQRNLEQSALMTGLYMVPWPLSVAIAAPLSRRLADKYSTGLICFSGGLLLAVGLGATSLWPLEEAVYLLIPFTMLCGLGFSLFNAANNRNLFLSASIERSGAAGGMQGTARLLGQTAGAVIMTVIFTFGEIATTPRIGFGLGAALTLFAALLSTLQIKRVA